MTSETSAAMQADYSGVSNNPEDRREKAQCDDIDKGNPEVFELRQL